jgi:hypothetical protein
MTAQTDRDHQDDDSRDPLLAAAANDIIAFALDRLERIRDVTGKTVDFHLVLTDGDYVETGGNLTHFDAMASTLSDVVGHWIDEGHVTQIEDEGDELLFTATFDPTKARLS